MTNKLVVIINSLKVPTIKKILVYEKSCTTLQLPPEPLTRGLPPPDPRSLCPLSSTEFVEPPPEQNSWVRHWFQSSVSFVFKFCLPCIMIQLVRFKPKKRKQFYLNYKNIIKKHQLLPVPGHTGPTSDSSQLYK